MILAAIDPSMSNTAIITSNPDDGPEGFRVRCFSSPSQGRSLKDRIDRYEKFVGQIVAHLENCAVTHLLIEGYSYNSTGSVIYLGELGGVLRWHLIDFPEAVEVPPSVVKKFATGKGNAKKEIVAAEIARRYNVSLASADEYDCYTIWRFGRCLFGIDQPLNKIQADAVESFRNPAPKKPKKRKQPKSNWRNVGLPDEPIEEVPY